MQLRRGRTTYFVPSQNDPNVSVYDDLCDFTALLGEARHGGFSVRYIEVMPKMFEELEEMDSKYIEKTSEYGVEYLKVTTVYGVFKIYPEKE